MKNSNHVFFISALVLIISQFLSCSSPTNPDPFESTITNIPVITGIVRTGPDSPTPLGIFGTPNEKSSLTVQGTGNLYKSTNVSSPIPITYSFYPLYPNPTTSSYSGQVNIAYGIPINEKISLWVVKGITPRQLNAENSLQFNAYVAKPSNNFYLKLDDGDKKAGRYQIGWNLKDSQGNLIPDGFYRIYLNINGNLLWRDLWIYTPKDDRSFPPTDIF